MKIADAACSAHGRHANPGGTDLAGWSEPSDIRRRDSGSRITFKKMTAGELARFWRGQEILVRQGIARGRRHVAPARLLC